MNNKFKKVVILGMAGLMVLGNGMAAFAVEVEADKDARSSAVVKTFKNIEVKSTFDDLPDFIQEQMEERKE